MSRTAKCSACRSVCSFVSSPILSDFPTKATDLAIVETLIGRLFQRGWVGAILVEPVQARGGINVPPPGFLPLLRKLCDRHGALLILDEIYTGFGRTGKWFACEHSGVVPDLICLGKALTGGFPLSACVGRADIMDAAWPPSKGEAIHTSTFLGHPVGCAMALAQIAEIEKLNLPKRSAELGNFLLEQLSTFNFQPSTFRFTARGLGLMAGVELTLPDGKPATELALKSDQKAVASRLHFPARRRTQQRHQLHAAADDYQTATGKSGSRARGGFAMTLTEMRELLAKRDIQLTRSLGQNFLHDGNQLRRIVDKAEHHADG